MCTKTGPFGPEVRSWLELVDTCFLLMNQEMTNLLLEAMKIKDAVIDPEIKVPNGKANSVQLKATSQIMTRRWTTQTGNTLKCFWPIKKTDME